MRHRPDLDDFRKQAAQFSLVPGLSPARRRHADARLRLSQDRGRRLVRSCSRASSAARRSAATASSAPSRSCASRPGAARVVIDGPGHRSASRSSSTPIRCDSRRDADRRYRAPHLPGLPRFCGGAVGYAGYDAVRYIEHLPDIRRPTTAACPTCRSPFTTAWSSSTTSTRRSRVVAHAHVDPRRPASAATTTPAGRVDRAGRAACSSGDAELPLADIATDGAITRTLPVELRAAATSRRPSRQCKEYIQAGDIFQVVLSQRLQVETTARAVRHLSHAAGRQSQPVHVLSAHAASVTPGRQLAGDHGPRRGRQGDDPPAGRHAPPRPDRGGGPRAWPRSCWPIPRSGPSTSCSSTWAATTSAASPATARCSSAT